MNNELHQVLSQMLSRREYAVNEARSKLLQKGYQQDDVEAAIAMYVYHDWLSDERYVSAKVASLQSRGYGPIYVKMLLGQMGLDIEPQDYCWQDAYAVAKRKAGGKEGLKLKQYLYRRGFTHAY